MDRRPTVIIVEPNPPDGLSTRKLVLETGKFNVLTAHSVDEAYKILDAFKATDALVIHTGLRHEDNLDKLVQHARQNNQNLAVYGVTYGQSEPLRQARANFAPEAANELLRQLRDDFGDPRSQIKTVDENDLARQEKRPA